MSWEVKSLDNIITFQRGFDLPKTDFKVGDFPVVGSTGIIGFHNEFKVKSPCVVTGRSGTLGVFQYLNEDFWAHNTTLWVKEFQGNHPKFIYYLLQTLDFKSLNGGVAVPTLNRNVLKNVFISYPKSLETQKRIASILSTYDDLIENNLKRIKLLEETAQNIYNEWFVNFRFPNYEHTEFDAESGLPVGWEKKRLDEVYEFQNGYAFYTNGYSEELTPYVVVDLGNISESGDFVVSGKEKFISESLYQDKERYYLNKYDVVVAMTDMTARLGILAKVGIIDEDAKYVLNQRVGRVRSKIDYIDYCYVNASLSDERFISEMHQRSKGAVQKYFNTKDIIEYNVVVPSKHIIDEFNILYRPIIENRIVLKFQNQKLKEARDILLPRLMNRTIEV